MSIEEALIKIKTIIQEQSDNNGNITLLLKCSGSKVKIAIQNLSWQ